MSDDSKTISLMFLKEQVLRWAALKRHSHKAEDIEDMDSKYAPVNHADASNKFGLGDTDKYGHVKVDDEISDSSINPVQNKVIKQAITDAINNLRNELINKLQEKFNIVTEITSSSTDKSDDKYNIPTAHAVWSALSNYKDLFVGRSWDSPKKIDENIDNMRTPGYFLQTGSRYFSYGGEKIYYTNALIRVERQSNRVIQHVYSTSKVSNGSDTTWKINGCEYTRWGTSETDWKSWHAAHVPYRLTSRAVNEGKGVDKGSVQVFENTAGFKIVWRQYAQENNRYPVSAPLYEYTDVCQFSPALPISGSYVIANLIGRFDVRITSNKMQIRSTVDKGGRIIEMDECWFIPRNN